MSKQRNKNISKPEAVPSWPSMDGQKPNTRSMTNVAHWLKLRGIVPHFNEFSNRIVIHIDGDRVECDDTLIRRIQGEMHEAGCVIAGTAVRDAIADAGRKNGFHAVRDFLGGLMWDGKPRLDSAAATYLGANDVLSNAMLRCWLLGAVRRVQRPGVKFDAILTLQGKQGVGKSSFFATIGGEWHNDSLLIGGTAKDTIENTSGSWIIEFSELSAMANREIEAVKSFASRTEDRARTAFERTASNVKRQFICGASTNSAKFLKDDTGNRRFWIIPVGAIDLDALRRDRDQLLAEAAAQEAKGESVNIAADLWSVVAQRNECYEIEDPVLDRTIALLTELPDNAAVTSEDLARAVGVPDVTRRGGKVATSIATGARRLGWIDSRTAITGVVKGGVRHYRSPRCTDSSRLFAWHGDPGKWHEVRPSTVQRPQLAGVQLMPTPHEMTDAI